MIKKFDEYIKESNDIPDYHSVVYCVRHGGHGDLGEFSTFDEAYKKAYRFLKDSEKKDELGDDEVMFIGVQGNTDKFAILYMTQKYFDSLDENDFSDIASYQEYRAIAKKYFETKKPQTGVYTSQTRLDL